MTVQALTKLEAGFRAPATDPDSVARPTGPQMRRTTTPAPQTMTPEFSGLGRAVNILHAKVHSERDALTVGADTSLSR